MSDENVICDARGCDRPFGVIFGDPYDETVTSQLGLCRYHLNEVRECLATWTPHG